MSRAKRPHDMPPYHHYKKLKTLVIHLYFMVSQPIISTWHAYCLPKTACTGTIFIQKVSKCTEIVCMRPIVSNSMTAVRSLSRSSVAVTKRHLQELVRTAVPGPHSGPSVSIYGWVLGGRVFKTFLGNSDKGLRQVARGTKGLVEVEKDLYFLVSHLKC